MNNEKIIQLTDDMQELNNGRHTRNQNRIAKCYKQIAATLNELYTASTVKTVLWVEKTLFADEQNGITKTSNTHKAISEHLSRIDKAETAHAEQTRNPKQYHRLALVSHAVKNCRDGTAFDAIRAALSECRKQAKDQITAIGADENEVRRECYGIRRNGLAEAERSYIERHVEYQEKYASREMRKQATANSLQSFDRKMKGEERELKMTPEPERKGRKERGSQPQKTSQSKRRRKREAVTA